MNDFTALVAEKFAKTKSPDLLVAASVNQCFAAGDASLHEMILFAQTTLAQPASPDSSRSFFQPS
jgi:hypothetical protein